MHFFRIGAALCSVNWAEIFANKVEDFQCIFISSNDRISLTDERRKEDHTRREKFTFVCGRNLKKNEEGVYTL